VTQIIRGAAGRQLGHVTLRYGRKSRDSRTAKRFVATDGQPFLVGTLSRSEVRGRRHDVEKHVSIATTSVGRRARETMPSMPSLTRRSSRFVGAVASVCQGDAG